MRALRQKTYSATASEAHAGQRWYVIDAEGQVLGRVATTVAQLLRGKGKPTFTPHMDGGDYVIVVNADKVVVTGNKETDKFYYRHSGYPGGLKATSLKDMRARHPHRILEEAVRGMLPKNRLGRRIFLHMKVYAGPEHPHEAQRPVRLELAREGRGRGKIVGVEAPAPRATAGPPPAAVTDTAPVEPLAVSEMPEVAETTETTGRTETTETTPGGEA